MAASICIPTQKVQVPNIFTVDLFPLPLLLPCTPSPSILLPFFLFLYISILIFFYYFLHQIVLRLTPDSIFRNTLGSMLIHIWCRELNLGQLCKPRALCAILWPDISLFNLIAYPFP